MLNINHPLFSFTVINHNRSMLNKKTKLVSRSNNDGLSSKASYFKLTVKSFDLLEWPIHDTVRKHSFLA